MTIELGLEITENLTLLIFCQDKETAEQYQPYFKEAKLKRAQWGDDEGQPTNWCLIINEWKPSDLDMEVDLILGIILNTKVKRFILRRDD